MRGVWMDLTNANDPFDFHLTVKGTDTVASAWASDGIAYGVCFGEEKTNSLFFTWGYGLGITWLLTEPFVIIFFTVLPQIFHCDVLGHCFTVFAGCFEGCSFVFIFKL